MDTIALERTIWINAPRERVWEALTDPAQVAAWFAPGTTFKTGGTGVGARLYVEDPETGAEMYVQVMEIYDPPRELIMRSQPEPPESAFTTHYLLEPEDNGTRLTLNFSGYEAVDAEVRDQLMNENGQGFELMLANIKAHIEGTPLPNPSGF